MILILAVLCCRTLCSEYSTLRQQGVRGAQVAERLRAVGMELFYHLVNHYNEDLALYPPSKQLLTACLETLGQVCCRAPAGGCVGNTHSVACPWFGTESGLLLTGVHQRGRVRMPTVARVHDSTSTFDWITGPPFHAYNSLFTDVLADVPRRRGSGNTAKLRSKLRAFIQGR